MKKTQDNVIELKATELDETTITATEPEKTNVLTKIANGAKAMWSKPIVKTLVIGGSAVGAFVLGKVLLSKNDDDELSDEDIEIDDGPITELIEE